MPSKHSAKVLSSVPKCKKAVMCLAEKISVLVKCYGLNIKCLPQAPVLKAWCPFWEVVLFWEVVESWEVEPSRRK
jgi:hypothetical protein